MRTKNTYLFLFSKLFAKSSKKNAVMQVFSTFSLQHLLTWPSMRLSCTQCHPFTIPLSRVLPDSPQTSADGTVP